jgi:hypothetical protein
MTILPDDPQHLPFLAALMVAAKKLGAEIELYERPDGRAYIQVTCEDGRALILFTLIMKHLSKANRVAASHAVAGLPLLHVDNEGRHCALWSQFTGHLYEGPDIRVN